VSVEALGDTTLRVAFADGTAGEVRLARLLQSALISGTVFEHLCDPRMFREVRVELGAVTWPSGADLAPDAMYDAICAHGHWDVSP